MPYKSIHKTTSGKIRRQYNKAAYVNNEFDIINGYMNPRLANGLIKGNGIMDKPFIENDVMKNVAEEIQNLIRAELAKMVDIDPSQVDIDLPFANYGIDSLLAVELENKLRKFLGTTYDIQFTDFINYPTVRLLAQHIEANIARRQ